MNTFRDTGTCSCCGEYGPVLGIISSQRSASTLLCGTCIKEIFDSTDAKLFLKEINRKST